MGKLSKLAMKSLNETPNPHTHPYPPHTPLPPRTSPLLSLQYQSRYPGSSMLPFDLYVQTLKQGPRTFELHY